MVRNLSILIFSQNFELDKFQAADFKYDNIAFKFQPRNTQIKHFWSQIYGFLFLDEILCLKKFEGTAVKYHSTVVFSSFSPKIPKQDKLRPTF